MLCMIFVLVSVIFTISSSLNIHSDLQDSSHHFNLNNIVITVNVRYYCLNKIFSFSIFMYNYLHTAIEVNMES